jgi:hypothetical protein
MWSGVLFIGAAVLVAKLVASRAFEQTSADGAAVRSTALDYLKGGREGDSTKHVRGIRPDQFTYGFWLPGDSTRAEGEQMPAAELPSDPHRMPAGGASTRAIASSSEFHFTTVLAWRAYAAIISRAEHS